MTENTPHSPLPGSVVPADVDPLVEKLSALVDGELSAAELVDLEELAVDSETTIAELSQPLARVRTDLTSLADQSAPHATRSLHIAAALDAMDSPEVASLSAARVQRRDQDATRFARNQRTNKRLQQLTKAAAAFVVLGGIGLLAASNIGSGSDSAEVSANFDSAGASSSEGPASDDGGGGGEAMEEAAEFEEEFDGAMSEDALSDEANAMSTGSSDDEAMEEEATATTAEAFQGADGEASAARLQLPPNVDLNQLDALTLADSTGYQRSQANKTTPVQTQCGLVAESAGVDRASIDDSVVVVQNSIEYELIILINGELRVFELPGCVQLD